MKVILQKDVPGLGDAGEVKNVADGYARNYLLPRKLGTAARGDSTKVLEHQKRMMQRKIDKRNKEMADVAEKLKALGTVSISVRVGAKKKLFGSVTPQAVANALKDLGYPVDKRKVELTDAVRTLGNFKFRVRLAEKVIVPMALEVLADKDSKVEEEEYVPPAVPQTEAAAPEAAAEAKPEKSKKSK
ncbi:MAG TPA: 50S ribosomal protein L9 [Leptospiraceae bacterium]|jgi:large subunit ribosomal protein L9|nr:50S ribosomal protein L9 [Leptospirales bacterium]HMU83401.1 50S ribosomal protein L9 [Leptospiraceae bacterium]HMX56259.1 50S ribosomal protein L9 [Leptospiraceae bacterium]HMY46200.1 50S ribosomal protein L9 [Leptospiraceae bacterium]HMZ37085.1 50S ribosomal protein L9 [Leptospiraceae bacterium]